MENCENQILTELRAIATWKAARKRFLKHFTLGAFHEWIEAGERVRSMARQNAQQWNVGLHPVACS